MGARSFGTTGLISSFHKVKTGVTSHTSHCQENRPMLPTDVLPYENV